MIQHPKQPKIYANVIADSICDGSRLLTIELQYWRAIHGEYLTHRVFSRNSMSSRAIPVAKMLSMVRGAPASPIHWGKNQPGMQAFEEIEGVEEARRTWSDAAFDAARHAEKLMALGLHKQVANRLLEPFQWMRTLVTSSDWDNWDALRMHKDAEPNIQALAQVIKQARDSSTPVTLSTTYEPTPYNCHLPYVLPGEKDTLDIEVCLKLSTARCARVSYLTHDGDNPDREKDVALYDRLVSADPIHASPAEHQAWAAMSAPRSNFSYIWFQHRKLIEQRRKRMVESNPHNRAL